ncbi:MAG: hypothetical protein CSB47_08595 [Proteobacteria bacterium]|nr:MAG: hypothetical protein CSB47_08595 [Pseudomonadota bacterium]
MMTNNKQILDSIFQTPDHFMRVVDDTQDDSAKLKPHEIRRNVEDYLERKALEQKLRDVFDDDYPLD